MQWERTVADYYYDEGWRLTYHIRGSIGTLDVSTSAASDGKSFAAEITTAQTTELPNGLYSLIGIVASGTDSREAYSGSLMILPNPSTLTAGHDPRSHAKKMLEALQSAQIMGGHRIVSYTIFGERSVTMMTSEQWTREFAFWEDRVNWEKKAEALKRGERIGVGIRFR